MAGEAPTQEAPGLSGAASAVAATAPGHGRDQHSLSDAAFTAADTLPARLTLVALDDADDKNSSAPGVASLAPEPRVPAQSPLVAHPLPTAKPPLIVPLDEPGAQAASHPHAAPDLQASPAAVPSPASQWIERATGPVVEVAAAPVAAAQADLPVPPDADGAPYRFTDDEKLQLMGLPKRECACRLDPVTGHSDAAD